MPKTRLTFEDGVLVKTETLPSPPPRPPDPNVALDAAIDGAASLTALKAVLRGRVRAR